MSCLHCTIVGCCRKIGPEMPSAELLAAAAKLTEAEAELRYFLEKKVHYTSFNYSGSLDYLHLIFSF